MADLAVTHTRKDRDGDILAIGVKNSWAHSKADAIRNIESRLTRYYVPWTDGATWIEVVYDRVKGKYLRTDHDNTTKNNLDDLPDL